VWCTTHFDTSNVTGHHRGAKRKLRAGYTTPSLQRTFYLCVALLCCKHYIFIVQYGIARFLCAMRVFDVRVSSSFIRQATFVPNFVSFAASIAELACGETAYSINDSLSHSPSLFDAPGTQAVVSKYSTVQARQNGVSKRRQFSTAVQCGIGLSLFGRCR